MTLVVSLHDVSPHTWELCGRILAELEWLGVRAVSLLVIPDHHHRGHFLRDEKFCEWLRARVAGGDEAVVHGYFHARTARAGESVRDRLVTRSYTAGEGEFYDIGYDDAKALAGRALGEFHEAKLRPCGFIAPAWLLSAEGERAIRDLGFAYTTRLRGVTDLRSGRVENSQSLCWSVRAAWRRVASLAWNASLFRRMTCVPVLRVAIHPVDIGHARVWRQITRLIAAVLATRRAVTYEQWLASGRV
jgi:uncharacterized protein